MTTSHPARRQAAYVFEEVVAGVRAEDERGHDAIALARELVSPRGALTLVHVHVVASKPAPDSGSVGDAVKRRHAIEQLTALARELMIGAQVSCVEARSVCRGLHEYASEHDADLLVVGASHYDELARDFVGDDASEVLRDPPCVVAVAPRGYAERGAAIERVGVAYNGSAESERAVALARRLAAQRCAELSAFEAVSAPIYARDPWNLEGDVSVHVEAARRRVAALGGLEADAGFGDPVEELAGYAESVDLLVMGSHKYRPIDRLLEHSTAQRMADDPSVPLLVLPSADRAAG
jgi:nucleotide-binding universal stress UspA family protein